MTHTVKVVEPGRSVTFTSDSPATAVFMAREWATKPTYPAPPVVYRSPLDGKSIRYPMADTNLCDIKPPTQGVVAQGFEAFGPMGERL